MSRSRCRWWCGLALASLALTACSGGGDAATPGPSSEASSAQSAPPPSDGELLTSLLSPADLGPDFSGPPPALGGGDEAAEDDEDVSDTPLCGIGSDLEEIAAADVGPMVTSDSAEQVYEEITVARDPGSAQEHLEVERARAQARCTFDETVEQTTYTVTVEGPVELDVGEEAAGLSQAYTGGYVGHRWHMTSRTGRVLVNVQYTSTSPIDPERARELLQKAHDKALPLS